MTMLDFDQLSYWEKQTYINHTDFLVIGSGIVGLSAAIHFKQRYKHKKVTIIERGYLPTGASTKNAGFACIGSPSELLDDLNHESEHTVFSTVDMRWRGLCYLRELLGDAKIDYQSNGSYELFKTSDTKTLNNCIDQLDYLNNNLKAITKIDHVFQLDHNTCSKQNFNGFKTAISNAAEGQLDTGKMVQSLLQLAQSLGITILNGIEAKEISNNRLTTNKGIITFDFSAICTNGFFKKLFPNEDVEPARAQVLITKPIKNLETKGIFHFDAGYYYFRNIHNRILFGGGRNLNLIGENTSKIENTNQITAQLKKILSENILPQTPFEIDYSWAGIMGVGKSKKPLIKQLDSSIFCAVRLGGMGVAIGSLVGKELAETIKYQH